MEKFDLINELDDIQIQVKGIGELALVLTVNGQDTCLDVSNLMTTVYMLTQSMDKQMNTIIKHMGELKVQGGC